MPKYETDFDAITDDYHLSCSIDGSTSVDSSNYVHINSLSNASIHMQLAAIPSSASELDYSSADNYLSFDNCSDDINCPRNYPTIDLISSSVSTGLDSYPPSAYQLESQPLRLQSKLIDGLSRQTLDKDPYRQQVEGHEQPAPFIVYPEHDGGGCIDTGGDVSIAPSPAGSAYDTDFNLDEMQLDRDEPYAKLIWRCLLEAPGHTMVLRDIYDWFRKNTDKGKDTNTKGWQNSIRHNLSMNKAFEKIDVVPKDGQKKGFVWRLSEQAQREGVQSTTRFRNKQPNKRGSRSSQPLGYRQAAGARGGAMARHAAAVRRSERLRKEISERLQYRDRSGQDQNLVNIMPTLSPTSYESYPNRAVTTSPFRQYPDQEQLNQYMNNRPMSADSSIACGPAMIESSFMRSTMQPHSGHFVPLESRPFLYDSSETDSQPRTPDVFAAVGDFADMAIDPSVFFGESVRSDPSAYGGSDMD